MTTKRVARMAIAILAAIPLVLLSWATVTYFAERLTAPEGIDVRAGSEIEILGHPESRLFQVEVTLTDSAVVSGVAAREAVYAYGGVERRAPLTCAENVCLSSEILLHERDSRASFEIGVVLTRS